MSRLRKTLLASLLAASLGVTACSNGGGGKSIRFAQSDSLGANYVVTQIGIQAVKKLGYHVSLSTVNTSMFFFAAAQDDLNLSMDINFPQQEPGFRKVADRTMLVGDGLIRGGGINGYMIDKKTADAHKITSLEQMRDPNIAGLFGRNGKADLINCDASWSCGEVVDYQLGKFGLRGSVTSVRGKYEALMVEAVSRVNQGQPAFYYAWSPSWMNKVLVPGKDVVWLPTPFDALPASVPDTGSALVPDVVGCAGDANPCRMAMAAWNYKTVANKTFIAAHPDVRVLFEQMSFPLAQWSAWEDAIGRDGGSDRVIRKLADAWILAHQAEFDGWIDQAKSQAPPPQ
jgi:glycine betaine/proline transport system substrate-binding protein